MSVSFLRSLLSGTAVAATFGVALLLDLFITYGRGDAAPLLEGFPGRVLGLAAAVGAIAGLVAARHAPSRGLAFPAGLLAGALGQLATLVLVFAGVSILTFDADLPQLDPLAWSEFAVALLTLLPAGLVGLVAAPLAVRRDDPDAPLRLDDLDAAYAHEGPADDAPDLDGSDAHDHADAHVDAHGDAHTDAHADAEAPADTRRLKCPECGTINEAVRGQRVRCYHCGLTGRSPA